MAKLVADMDWVEVNALIEACQWPSTSPVAPFVGRRGTDAERKAALAEALAPIEAEDERAGDAQA